MKSLSQLITALTLFTGFVLQSSATVIVDDTWADGSRTNAPVSSSSALWYVNTSTDSTNVLRTTVGSMALTNAASSRLALGYFTADPASPVSLAVGDALKLTLVFTPVGTLTNAPASSANNVRIGLYYTDPANGGIRTNRDISFIGASSAPGSGTGASGYLMGLNFATAFTRDTPIEFRARTNVSSPNLMGSTTGFYEQVGSSGPAGQMGLPAFAAGTTYTLAITITRYATSNVLSATLNGGALNLAWSATDPTHLSYTKFDTFAFRCVTAADTADAFVFTDFKVETIPGGSTTPIPLNAQLSGGNIVLSWNNPVFALQSAASVTGPYSTIAGATSPFSTNTSSARQFFRVRAD